MRNNKTNGKRPARPAQSTDIGLQLLALRQRLCPEVPMTYSTAGTDELVVAILTASIRKLDELGIDCSRPEAA